MKGIYPGSFDPPTAGHIDLIKRASGLCDELLVAVMVNPSKAGAFTPEDRVEMLKKACSDLKNLKISFYFGMLSDIIKREHCDCIIRGVRNTADFETEKDRAEANLKLSGNPMNRSTPSLPIHHRLPEFTQTDVHRVSNAIQPSHPLSSPSPAPNPSQHQGLFQ